MMVSQRPLLGLSAVGLVVVALAADRSAADRTATPSGFPRVGRR